jgi:hypothetical protein
MSSADPNQPLKYALSEELFPYLVAKLDAQKGEFKNIDIDASVMAPDASAVSPGDLPSEMVHVLIARFGRESVDEIQVRVLITPFSPAHAKVSILTKPETERWIVEVSGTDADVAINYIKTLIDQTFDELTQQGGNETRNGGRSEQRSARELAQHDREMKDTVSIVKFSNKEEITVASLDTPFSEVVDRCREILADPKLTEENFGEQEYFFFRNGSTAIQDALFFSDVFTLRKMGLFPGAVLELCYVPK